MNTAPVVPRGSEILVNTATASNQFDPLITALVGGGFVVTWLDNSQGVGGATGDTSGFAVKAQVFSATGGAVGSEILVNTATANNQLTPQITALANGGFVVTWDDDSLGVGGATEDASVTAVKAQVFNATGGAVGSEILVNTAVSGAQFAPQITALVGGGFVVTWEDRSLGVGGAGGDASNSAVKAQVFNATGGAVGSEIRVNTATANAQDAAQITALANGGFVVTWMDGSLGIGGATGDASGFAVKAQVFNAAGGAVGSEILVNTATFNSQFFPQITALANGGFAVTWEDESLGLGGATGDSSSSAVKAQVFDAAGGAVGSEIRVNTATANLQRVPQITALANGGFVVTWEDNSLGVGGATGDASDTAVKAQVFFPALNTGDFNADFFSDLLWRHAIGTTNVFLMNGATVVADGNISRQADNIWKILDKNDFNGDARADILWRNVIDGTTNIFLMDGHTVIADGNISQQADNSWQFQDTGDFNGDGRADILWRNDDGTTNIYHLNGHTVFGDGNISVAVDNSWEVAGATDFNGDGNADILWRNVVDGTSNIFLMNATTVIADGNISAQLDSNWTVQDTADFNGDGHGDILFRHADGTAKVFLMDGHTVEANLDLSQQLDNNWAVEDTGDFNADGLADIAWRHTDGTVKIFFMNGAVVTDSADTSVFVDNSWELV